MEVIPYWMHIYSSVRACAITYNREFIGKYGLVATSSCVPSGFATSRPGRGGSGYVPISPRHVGLRSEEIAAKSCSIVNGFAIITLQGTRFDLHSYPLAPLT
jgi:hypothetical protein